MPKRKSCIKRKITIYMYNQEASFLFLGMPHIFLIICIKKTRAPGSKTNIYFTLSCSNWRINQAMQSHAANEEANDLGASRHEGIPRWRVHSSDNKCTEVKTLGRRPLLAYVSGKYCNLNNCARFVRAHELADHNSAMTRRREATLLQSV